MARRKHGSAATAGYDSALDVFGNEENDVVVDSEKEGSNSHADDVERSGEVPKY